MTHSAGCSFWVFAIATTSLFGCAGASVEDGSGGTANNADSSNAGNSNAGSSNGGTANNGGNSGGANARGGAMATGGRLGVGGTIVTGGAASFGGSAGGPTVCCAAVASCNTGDLAIPSQLDCPQGLTCYSRTLCCSTVWCATGTALCDAIPTCNNDDTLVTGPCPPSDVCYNVSLCGSTITCRRNTACNPVTEYNRNYVATSPSSCQVIKYSCPANTSMFSNACGCGCEQASTCPEYANCMPGSLVDPSQLCGDGTLCPYTERAM